MIKFYLVKINSATWTITAGEDKPLSGEKTFSGDYGAWLWALAYMSSWTGSKSLITVDSRYEPIVLNIKEV